MAFEAVLQERTVAVIIVVSSLGSRISTALCRELTSNTYQVPAHPVLFLHLREENKMLAPSVVARSPTLTSLSTHDSRLWPVLPS